MIKYILAFLLLCTPLEAATMDVTPIVDIGGYIEKSGLTYTGYDNTYSIVAYNISSAIEDRGYMSFDTQNDVPKNITISQIDLYIGVQSSSATPGFPSTWVTSFQLGFDIIDGDLTTNEAAIWTSSDWIEVYELTGQPTDQTQFTICDTVGECMDMINWDGITDLCIDDQSLYDEGAGAWQTAFYNESGRTTKLILTYTRNIINNAVINQASLYEGVAK